jgi:hypothetical protein
MYALHISSSAHGHGLTLQTETIQVPDLPVEGAASKTHAVPFSRVVYIDRSDFQTAATKGA